MRRPGLESCRTALYRFFDATNRLLYLGIAVDPEARWLAHQHTKWWPLAVRHSVEWFSDRATAHAAEIAAIDAEHPLYNRAHANYHPPLGMSVSDVRRSFAEVVRAANEGEVIYVTSRGQRIAAFVPVDAAERFAP